MRKKLMLTLSIAALAALILSAAANVHAAPAAGAHGQNTTTLAVFGDAPYGTDQFALFPSFVDAINADPSVRLTVHVGDIKNGSSRCDDSYFDAILVQFDRFLEPLVYTPGDNEWTDCHRKKAGKFDPLERLAKVRDLFFPVPGLTLGEPRLVFSQSWLPWWHEFVENVLWTQARVVFATVNVPGSNNDLVPWFTDDDTDTLVDDPARRTAEWDRRTDANVAWLVQAFAAAELTHARGVVIFMQADIWDGAPLDGFDPIAQVFADLAADFGKPVLLIQGDSHVYKEDRPFEHGDPVHHVVTAAPNVTRIVVHGETLPFEYLRLSVDARSAAVFSWERVPVAPVVP